jgi:hypothetical protein
MKGKIIAFVISTLVLFCLSQWSFAATFDHSQFDLILKEYVDDKGLIDYNGIAKDPRFHEYIESLKTAKVEELSREGQLAFWLNAYNAITIDKVIKWKPKKSVRETIIPGVWISTKFYTSRENIVAGRMMSPDDIENDKLRKGFQDPRIHFAIICASSSCPPMPHFAYTEEKVQAQLESETKKYINSPRGTRIDRADNTLYISKIFDWFKDDFIFKAGSVMEFIKPYLKEETLTFLKGNPKIDYIQYDWALNAQEPVK